MKTKFLTLAFSVMALLSANVFAGDSLGLITSPGINKQGILFFGAGTHNNKPTCSTVGDGQGWALDITTPAGRSMQAFIMLAYAQGKALSINGDNTCPVSGDRETPTFIYAP